MQIISQDELVERIAKAMLEMNGQDLADLFNRDFGQNCCYCGDSQFTVEPDVADTGNFTLEPVKPVFDASTLPKPVFGTCWQKTSKLPVIEVCERLGDHHLVPERDVEGHIVVGPDKHVNHVHAPKYHAQIGSNGGNWGCGTSIDEAIGNLVQNAPEKFGMTVEFMGKLAR